MRAKGIKVTFVAPSKTTAPHRPEVRTSSEFDELLSRHLSDDEGQDGFSAIRQKLLGMGVRDRGGLARLEKRDLKLAGVASMSSRIGILEEASRIVRDNGDLVENEVRRVQALEKQDLQRFEEAERKRRQNSHLALNWFLASEWEAS